MRYVALKDSETLIWVQFKRDKVNKNRDDELCRSREGVDKVIVSHHFIENHLQDQIQFLDVERTQS